MIPEHLTNGILQFRKMAAFGRFLAPDKNQSGPEMLVFTLYIFSFQHILKATRKRKENAPMFLSMKVPRGSVEDELGIVCRELDAAVSPAYVPVLFLKWGLEIIRRIEQQQHVILEPRVGIDLGYAARAAALENSRSAASHHDIISAIPAAVKMNSSAAEPSDLAVEQNTPDIARFLQRELPQCNFPGLLKKIPDSGCAAAQVSPQDIRLALLAGERLEELEALSDHVLRHETLPNFRIHEVIAAYLNAYREGVALELQARGRRG